MTKSLMISLLLILSSCNSGTGSNDDKKREEAHCLCTPVYNWTLDSSNVNFPENFSITMDDTKLLDTCSGSKPKIEEISGRNLISFSSYLGNIKQGVKLDVNDLGADCTNSAIFSSEIISDFTKTQTSFDRSKPYVFEIKLRLDN